MAGNDSDKLETLKVRLDLYEQEDPVVLKVIKCVSEGVTNDLELYWFDSDDSDVPCDNSNWDEIKENLDIFDD